MNIYVLFVIPSLIMLALYSITLSGGHTTKKDVAIVLVLSVLWPIGLLVFMMFVAAVITEHHKNY